MDIAWGLGFVILSWVFYIFMGMAPMLFLILITLHQLRLSGYIFWRVINKPEDKRYAGWRKSWGKTFLWRSFLQIFILQGLIMGLIVVGFFWEIPNQTPLWMQIVGSILWIYGMLYEVIGDAQLARFKANPKNKGSVLQNGLWARTRHPNYWGECVIWWSYWILLGMSPFALLGPVLMTFLLTRVSGVRMTESSFQGNETYIEYQRNVPSFYPSKHLF